MTRLRPKVRKRERSRCLCPTIFEDKLRVPLAYKHIQTSCGFAAGWYLMVFGIPAVVLKICSRKIMGLQRKPMYTEFFEPHRCDRRLCWRLMTQNGSRKNSGGRAWQKDEMHKVRWMPNWNFSSIFIWFGIVLSSHSPSIWYLSFCIEGRLRSSAKSGIATSAVRASSCLKLRLFRMVTVILMIFFVGLSDGSCSRT